MTTSLADLVDTTFQFTGESITLGAAMHDGQTLTSHFVGLPLSMINRHGLVAGATGTGKTKTLQHFIEQLSHAWVPVRCMDIKGDLSGLSQPGVINDKIKERYTQIWLEWQPLTNVVEFFTLSGQPGVQVRSTISEMWPILIAKILQLNDTQASILAVIFKYCDDQWLLLIDLPDLKAVMTDISWPHQAIFETSYGAVSQSSIAVIMRQIVVLEGQWWSVLFGEPSLEIDDIVRSPGGLGQISLLRLADIQSQPQLFSTFMLWLMTEVYRVMPEEGDVSKPKLVIIVDEAHLLFAEASSELLHQMETMIKLIRSKGVALRFCTQTPSDIPESILGQLGTKIQHAIRVFTAKDAKSIKLIAENFPHTNFYHLEEQLTTLGTGQAMVVTLDEKWSPTPVVQTMICAPGSRMDTITDIELAERIWKSDLISKYSKSIDTLSAREKLLTKIESLSADPSPLTPEGKSSFEKIIDNPIVKQVGRTLAREVTRGLLGMLWLWGTRRR